jgi:hypothetical protein
MHTRIFTSGYFLLFSITVCFLALLLSSCARPDSTSPPFEQQTAAGEHTLDNPHRVNAVRDEPINVRNRLLMLEGFSDIPPPVYDSRDDPPAISPKNDAQNGAHSR